MVNWKIALFVIVIAILIVAIGMWFGYQYVSEQDDFSPEGSRVSSKTPNLCRDTSCVSALTPRENRCCNVTFPNTDQFFLRFLKKEI